MRHWHLAAAVGWLVIAGLLMFRDALLPDEAAEAVRGRNWTVAAWLAVVFVFWNLARWYQARARRTAVPPGRLPLQPTRAAGTQNEYNPEFDFEKRPGEPGA